MRVAFLFKRFPLASESFVATQMIGLLREGHDVSAVSQLPPVPGEPLHEEIVRADLLARTFYVRRKLPVDSHAPDASIPIAAGRHDVLHAHFGPAGREFLFARAQADAPLVVSFHGYDFSSHPAEHGPSIYDELFEVADVVTHNCEHARHALEQLGCPPDKLRPLRVAIDVGAFPFRERRRHEGEPLRILTVARLVEKKGHEIALRALAAARSSLPDFEYDIVGGGELAGRLARLACELGLTDVVRLHGTQDSTYVRRLLAEAHVFVLASTTARNGDQEGTPVALMEAQACRLPVVSTRHSGIPEVVLDRKTGVLVPPGDPEALAAAIVRVTRQPESWPPLGAAGRAHVEATFDLAGGTEQLLGVYRSAASAYTLSLMSSRMTA